MKKMVAKQPVASHARLAAFARGVVYGMALAGLVGSEIREEIENAGGQPPSRECVRQTLATCKANGGLRWDGGCAAASAAGRPRETPPALDNAIRKVVFKHRGKAKVTVAFVRKVLFCSVLF